MVTIQRSKGKSLSAVRIQNREFLESAQFRSPIRERELQTTRISARSKLRMAIGHLRLAHQAYQDLKRDAFQVASTALVHQERIRRSLLDCRRELRHLSKYLNESAGQPSKLSSSIHRVQQLERALYRRYLKSRRDGGDASELAPTTRTTPKPFLQLQRAWETFGAAHAAPSGAPPVFKSTAAHSPGNLTSVEPPPATIPSTLPPPRIAAATTNRFDNRARAGAGSEVASLLSDEIFLPSAHRTSPIPRAERKTPEVLRPSPAPKDVEPEIDYLDFAEPGPTSLADLYGAHLLPDESPSASVRAPAPAVSPVALAHPGRDSTPATRRRFPTIARVTAFGLAIAGLAAALLSPAWAKFQSFADHLQAKIPLVLKRSVTKADTGISTPPSIVAKEEARQPPPDRGDSPYQLITSNEVTSLGTDTHREYASPPNLADGSSDACEPLGTSAAGPASTDPHATAATATTQKTDDSLSSNNPPPSDPAAFGVRRLHVAVEENSPRGDKVKSTGIAPGPAKLPGGSTLSPQALLIRNGFEASRATRSVSLGVSSEGDWFGGYRDTVGNHPLNVVLMDFQNTKPAAHVGIDAWNWGTDLSGASLYTGVTLEDNKLDPHLELRATKSFNFLNGAIVRAYSSVGYMETAPESDAHASSTDFVYTLGADWLSAKHTFAGDRGRLNWTSSVFTEGTADSPQYLMRYALGHQGNYVLMANPGVPTDIELSWGTYLEGNRDFNPEHSLLPGARAELTLSARHKYWWARAAVDSGAYISETGGLSSNFKALLSLTRRLEIDGFEFYATVQGQWSLEEEGTRSMGMANHDFFGPEKSGVKIFLSKIF